MATRMQQRRGTASEWTSANPILASGEIGFETDTNQFRIGDGVTNWSNLSYFETLDDIQSFIDNAVAGVVDSAPDTLNTLNELAAALNDDANAFTTLSNQITSGDSATLTSAQSYADAAESDAISAAALDATNKANTAESNANTYTDGEISTLDASLKAYADQSESDAISAAASDATTKANAALSSAQSYTDTAEADAISTANSYTDARETAITSAYQLYADTAESDAVATAASDATTKANSAEANANGYTNSLIGDGTVDGTVGNTVVDRINSAISGIIDAAPETLDTLNEIAAALNDDANAFTTLNNEISSGDSTTLASANSYTDSQISGVEPTFTNTLLLMGV